MKLIVNGMDILLILRQVTASFFLPDAIMVDDVHSIRVKYSSGYVAHFSKPRGIRVLPHEEGGILVCITVRMTTKDERLLDAASPEDLELRIAFSKLREVTMSASSWRSKRVVRVADDSTVMELEIGTAEGQLHWLANLIAAHEPHLSEETAMRPRLSSDRIEICGVRMVKKTLNSGESTITMRPRRVFILHQSSTGITSIEFEDTYHHTEVYMLTNDRTVRGMSSLLGGNTVHLRSGSLLFEFILNHADDQDALCASLHPTPKRCMPSACPII